MTERMIMDSNFDQIGLAFFQPLPGTPVWNQLIASGEISEDFTPGRYSELTYCPKGVEAEEIVTAFNRIMNNFRKKQGWTFKDDAVGKLRL